MLQTIRHVGQQEPSVGIGQVVIDRVATGDGTVGFQCVQVVIGSTNTQLGFEQAG